MLIAISGSQGSGKTTILNEIKRLGLNIIERKTARSVMSNSFPGMTLDDIYRDPATAVAFQDIVLETKYDDEEEAVKSNHLWFTERTYADLFTYAVMAVGKNNQYSDWLDKYYEKCKDCTQGYLHTFYIQGGHFNPANDGVRGINKHYQAMIDRTLSDYVGRMLTPPMEGFPETLTIIRTPILEDRVEEILTRSIQLLLDAQKH